MAKLQGHGSKRGVLTNEDKVHPEIREKIENIVIENHGEGLLGGGLWVFSPSGVPDLLVYSVDGGNEFFFVEVKSEGDGLRESQIWWLTHMESFTLRIAFVKDSS